MGEREAYISALISNINAAPECGEPVKSVYFGGGTPTVLKGEQLYRVLYALDEKYHIKNAERTLEVNPDSVGTAAESFPLWFNRFSMGVQSFDDGELSLLGRRHNAAEAEKAYKIMRGFADNINLDLIIGIPLPGHEKTFKKSLEKLISLEPEHVSVYILKYEQGTPMYGLRDRELSDDIVSELYLYASDELSAHGYEHYEISNFSKPGRRSVHNSAYWKQERYLAFGPGAYGFDGTTRYHYAKDTKGFISSGGKVLPLTDEILDADALKSERIMLSLRMSDGIDGRLFSEIISDPAKKRYTDILLKNKLARIGADGSFALTLEGWLVSNSIIEELM